MTDMYCRDIYFLARPAIAELTVQNEIPTLGPAKFQILSI
jgi:hypothetical protein